MTGQETGGRRGTRGILLRRVVVAVASATLVAVIGSRVNRPWPSMLEDRASATTTTSSANDDTFRRLYDVRDLLDEAEAWSKPLRPLRPHHRSTGLFGGGGGAGLFGQTGALFSSGAYSDQPPTRASDIAELIRATITPEAWDDPETPWNVFGWGGWVMVDAAPHAHREVERFLALLRRGDSEPFLRRGRPQ